MWKVESGKRKEDSGKIKDIYGTESK